MTLPSATCFTASLQLSPHALLLPRLTCFTPALFSVTKEPLWTSEVSISWCVRCLQLNHWLTFNPESKQHYITNVKNESDISSLTHPTVTTTATGTQMAEQSRTPSFCERIGVDIIEDKNEIDPKITETEDPDATEYSSSFADTTPDADICSGLSDAEAESNFFGDSEFGPDCDAFSTMFHVRKKKLTDHWRTFIRPLMWRCKWTELRIKEIESHARKYSRELEAYEQAKLQAVEASIVETFGSRSLLHCNPYHRKVAKRGRRKKVEYENDIASYMSRHNLFSYIEMKRSNPDGATLADDFAAKDLRDCKSKLALDNDDLIFEASEADDSLEQVLLRIETVHSQVNKLKRQLDLLMSKHAAKFSSSENLSLLAACDAQTSSGLSPTVSAGNGDAVSVGAMYSPNPDNDKYDIGELVLPEEGISSYVDVLYVPDIIESTVGLLSSADVTLHQPQIGDLSEDILDNVLIHNEAVEAERHAFIETSYQPTAKDLQAQKVEGPSEPDDGCKPAVCHEQFVLQSCLASEIRVPRNKRKRGERRAGSWCKKHSSDPESQ